MSMPKGKANSKKNNPNDELEKYLPVVERLLETGDFGSFEVAEVTLRDLIRQTQSKSPLANVLLGRIYAELNKFSDGEKFIGIPQVDRSNDPKILFHLACFLIAVARYPFGKQSDADKNYGLAIEKLNHCLSSKSNDPKALCMLGVATAGLDQYEDGMKWVDLAIFQARKNETESLGMLYFERAMLKKSRAATQEDYQKILDDLNQAVECDFQNQKYADQKKIVLLKIKNMKKDTDAESEAKSNYSDVKTILERMKKTRKDEKLEDKERLIPAAANKKGHEDKKLKTEEKIPTATPPRLNLKLSPSPEDIVPEALGRNPSLSILPKSVSKRFQQSPDLLEDEVPPALIKPPALKVPKIGPGSPLKNIAPQPVPKQPIFTRVKVSSETAKRLRKFDAETANGSGSSSPEKSQRDSRIPPPIPSPSPVVHHAYQSLDSLPTQGETQAPSLNI